MVTAEAWLQVAPPQISFTTEESALLGEASHLGEKAPDLHRHCSHARRFQATARHYMISLDPLTSLIIVRHQLTVYMVGGT